MVISSNLSLIPYRQDNYTLQPVNHQMMLPDRELGHQAIDRNGLSRRPTVGYHCNHTDHQNLTYNQNLSLDSSQIDQLGTRVDIYIWCFTSWTSIWSGNFQSEMPQLNSQKSIKIIILENAIEAQVVGSINVLIWKAKRIANLFMTGTWNIYFKCLESCLIMDYWTSLIYPTRCGLTEIMIRW